MSRHRFDCAIVHMIKDDKWKTDLADGIKLKEG